MPLQPIYKMFASSLGQLAVMTADWLSKRNKKTFEGNTLLCIAALDFAIFYLIIANRVLGSMLSGKSEEEYVSNVKTVADYMRNDLISAFDPSGSKELKDKLVRWFDETLQIHVVLYSELPLESQDGEPCMITTFQEFLLKDLGAKENTVLGSQISLILDTGEDSFIVKVIDNAEALAPLITGIFESAQE